MTDHDRDLATLFAPPAVAPSDTFAADVRRRVERQRVWRRAFAWTLATLGTVLGGALVARVTGYLVWTLQGMESVPLLPYAGVLLILGVSIGLTVRAQLSEQ